MQWIANRSAICTATGAQTQPQICSYGSGGVIITWIDERSESESDIYAQWIMHNIAPVITVSHGDDDNDDDTPATMEELPCYILVAVLLAIGVIIITLS